jgi:hypothetical protein
MFSLNEGGGAEHSRGRQCHHLANYLSLNPFSAWSAPTWMNTKDRGFHYKPILINVFTLHLAPTEGCPNQFNPVLFYSICLFIITNSLHAVGSYLRAWRSLICWTHSPPCMEPTGPLPRSQVFITGPYPEPAKPAPHRYNVFKVHSNNILPSRPWSFKWSPFRSNHC